MDVLSLDAHPVRNAGPDQTRRDEGSPHHRAEFLELLTEPERAELSRRGRVRHWERDAVLLGEGERSDWVAVVLHGKVKVSSHTTRGGEVLLAVYGPGALVGELAAIDGQPRSATVTALEDMTALVVPFVGFGAYLQAHGRVSYLLMRLLAERLRDANRKRVEFGAHNSTGRVAARLAELAERFGQPTDHGIRVALALSQGELASWTGVSREAVSKALGVFRAYAWVTTGRRQIVIQNLAALQQLAS